MKKSRVGEYVVVDTNCSRELSANSKFISVCRYFGSDGEWHHTLRDTPTWKTWLNATSCASPHLASQHTPLRVVKIVKKKAKPLAHSRPRRLCGFTNDELLAELAHRLEPRVAL